MKYALVLAGLALALIGVSARADGASNAFLNADAWALLVAGSKGLSNYRHQADVSHAYHVMLAVGIPADRIVVMMYDDVANDKDNPWPGKLFNKPNGTNVYAGVKIDYREKDVTPRNFLNVLSGNKAAMKGIGTERVIESNERNNVFVFFSDHGLKGGLCFPAKNCTQILFADDMNKTLSEMREAKRYKKIIMYIEACYAASLFENMLDENSRVFAMVAANRDESSYPTHCIKGENISDSMYMGDEFSVSWMERLEKQTKSGDVRQIFHQFQAIRAEVRNSHVEIYGDFSFGFSLMTPNHVSHDKIHQNSSAPTQPDAYVVPCNFELQTTEITKIYDELIEALLTLATTDFPKQKAAVENSSLPITLDVFPCYKDLTSKFIHDCQVEEHGYLMDFYNFILNLCILKLDSSKLVNGMAQLCKTHLSRLNDTMT